MIDKASIDIISVISRYTEVKKMGSNYAAKCPFHSTNTYDSFRINPNKQIFRCFNCMDKAGDAIDFVMKIENVSFSEALDILAIKDFTPKIENKKKPDIKKDIFKPVENPSNILKEAVSYWNKHKSSAIQYLDSRGIHDEELINHLKIGYAPKGGLYNHLLSSGINKEQMLDSGLIKKGEYGYYDFFRNRVIFPILDTSGNIVSITSRATDNQTVKHLHLKGDIQYLYNEIAIKTSPLIIVEGISDCLSLLQEGFNACAIYGTCGLSDILIQKLSIHNPKVFIAFDMDSNQAGQRGARKAITNLLNNDIETYLVKLPFTGKDKIDINDLFYNEGFTKEDFIELLRQSIFIEEYVNA